MLQIAIAKRSMRTPHAARHLGCPRPPARASGSADNPPPRHFAFQCARLAPVAFLAPDRAGAGNGLSSSSYIGATARLPASAESYTPHPAIFAAVSPQSPMNPHMAHLRFRRPLLAWLTTAAQPAALVLVGCPVMVGSVTASPSFMGLGTLPEDLQSDARSVSADGSVVVGFSEDANVIQHGFRWTRATGMVDLGTPSGQAESVMLGVSGDGRTAVGFGANFQLGGDGLSLPVRWRSAEGMMALATLPQADVSFASAANADGSVVVGQENLRGADGFIADVAVRWTSEGGIEDLGFLNGVLDSTAAAVSADGSVVVGISTIDASNHIFHAFRWTSAEGMVDLGTLPGGTSSFANGISADGLVIVGSSDSSAIRWTRIGGMVSLSGLPGASASSAEAVSSDGSVVVGLSYFGNQEPHAVFWTAKLGPVDLKTYLIALGVDLAGWELYWVTSVSSDGLTMVGSGSQDGGVTREGWVATLPSFCHGGDFNHSGTVNVQDVFDFLAAWFAGSPSADFNHAGPPVLRDIFAFLKAWLAGCP